MLLNENLNDKSIFASWSGKYPRKQMAPVFIQDEKGFTVKGNEKDSVYGYFSKTVDVSGGKCYKFTVRFNLNGNKIDPNLFAICFISWQNSHMSGGSSPVDGICNFMRDGEDICGTLICKAMADITKAEIMLGIRYAPSASITFKSVGFEEAKEEASRPVKVSAVRYDSQRSGSSAINKNNVEELVKLAHDKSSDLIVLPEFCSLYDRTLEVDDIAENVPNGDFCKFLSRLAEKYNMNICCGILEEENEIIYNTAVLYDRKGIFKGKYRKTHLYFPEGLWQGTTPGNDFPVFDLDIGRVGIIVCYDFWYGECARIMGLKGAEILLFPNAGHEEKLVPARAIDNNIFIVCSTLNSPACIVNTLGEHLALIDKSKDKACETVEIDLTQRRLPHPNAGGNMNPGSGGRRCARNSVSDKLYREILTEMNIYTERNEPYKWL